MIASGEFSRKVSRRGARESAAPLWQVAQERWNTAAPSGGEVCASAIPADRLSPAISFTAEVIWRARDVSSQPPKRRKLNRKGMISLRVGAVNQSPSVDILPAYGTRR